MIKTGILSGSFNPIHIGHLALANYLCEFEGFDQIWFVVTPHNPLKEKETLTDDVNRLDMVALAIKGYDKFKCSDIEFSLPKPSYTIHTLNVLQKKFPNHNFHLLIGADNWLIFDQWKDYDQILSQHKLMIYPRNGISIELKPGHSNVIVSNAPSIDVSSTFIRQAIMLKKDIRFFLPCGVYDYIIANHLYQNKLLNLIK